MSYNLKILDNKFKEFFSIILIFITSFTFNIYYGSIGVFPIDTFAFFDSANFINKGFLPIRDYWTSNGFFVDILQSFFFKILGVNWYSYLFHSSLINFFFATLTYKFLKSEGLTESAALFYSLSVAILFYPPVGVPFSDHHSITFSLISIYFLIFTIKTQSKLFLLITILSLSIAFLCKQVPAGFFLILIGLYLVYFSLKKQDKGFLIYIFSYTFFIILIFISFLFITKIEIKDFFIQYVSFPLSIGSERSNLLRIQSIFLSLINEFKFISLLILIICFQIINFKKKNYEKKKIFSAIIFLFVSIILILNQEMMKNQNIIFFIIPILIGIIHNLITHNKEQKMNYFILLLIVLNIFVTFKYHERFNENRKFMDFRNINKSNFIDASKITDKLKGLKWITSQYSSQLQFEVDHLKESIIFLKANKDKSIIITYYQFINSEIDHDIYSPNRWYTSDGVSYPIKGNKYYENYVEFFKEKLVNKNINKVYTIDPLGKSTFDFIFKTDCIKTQKINDILSQHNITNCFANSK